MEEVKEETKLKVKASAKYQRISPKKLGRILNLVRGKRVEVAEAELRFLPQKGARIIEEVLKTGIANATHNYKMAPAKLRVVAAWAGPGAMLKRVQPVSRGRAHPIKKRTAHVTLYLGE